MTSPGYIPLSVTTTGVVIKISLTTLVEVHVPERLGKMIKGAVGGTMDEAWGV